jgi:hypothetical protein
MAIRNVTNQLLITLAAVAALQGCGGSSGSDTPDVADINLLPDGKVGTVGDLVNKAEYEAISCGMTKEQVMAIVVDQPTKVIGEYALNSATLIWNNGRSIAAVGINGVVDTKLLSFADATHGNIIRC